MTIPDLGSPAPDFALNDQYGQEQTLRALLDGRALLLVFYPFAFSPVCEGELTGIQADLSAFDNETLRTVGISCDPMFALKAWGQEQGLDLPLLSDFWPHGEVATAYGVLADFGAALRGTFLLDPAGVVRWTLVNPPGEARDFGPALQAVSALGGAAD